MHAYTTLQFVVFFCKTIVIFFLINSDLSAQIASQISEDIKNIRGGEDNIQFVSDEIEVDTKNKILKLTSNSVLTSPIATLSAGSIIYDHTKKLISATGGVKLQYHSVDLLLETDEIKINSKFQIKFAKNVRITLSDNRTAIIKEIRHIKDNIHHLDHIKFLPCHTCDDGRTQAKWYINSHKGILDLDKGFIKIMDNDLYIFDLKVGGESEYTIYLPKSNKGVSRRKSLQTAKVISLQGNKVLGIPYKYYVNNNEDLTLTPYFSVPILTRDTEVNEILKKTAIELEYSYKKNRQSYNLTAFFQRDETRQALGDDRKNEAFFLHADVNFIVAENWQVGGVLNIVSDYNVPADVSTLNKPNIKRNFYVRSANERNYTNLYYTDFFTYQEFERPTQSSIRPRFVYEHYFKTKQRNKDLYFNIDMMNVVRTDISDASDIPDTDVMRMSTKLEYTSQHIYSGHVLKLGLSGITNSYLISPRQNDLTNNSQSEATFSMAPGGYVDYRYPLIVENKNATGIKQFLIEPRIVMIGNYNIGKKTNIQAVDSTIPILQVANIFDANKYSGYDKDRDSIEIVYGVNIEITENGYDKVLLRFGRNYKIWGQDKFDPIGAQEGRSSDYIIGANLYASYLGSINSNFRLSKKSFSLEESYIIYNSYIGKIDLSLGYLHLNDSEDGANYREIVASTQYPLTEHLSLDISVHYDSSQKFVKEMNFALGMVTESVKYGLTYERQASQINEGYTNQFGAFLQLHKFDYEEP